MCLFTVVETFCTEIYCVSLLTLKTLQDKRFLVFVHCSWDIFVHRYIVCPYISIGCDSSTEGGGDQGQSAGEAMHQEACGRLYVCAAVIIHCELSLSCTVAMDFMRFCPWGCLQYNSLTSLCNITYYMLLLLLCFFSLATTNVLVY